MWETPFLEWLLNVSNFAVMSGANLLVQSTIIIAVGLTALYALRKKGAAVQSLVLRAFLVAVLLSPFISSHFNTPEIRKLTFNIPPVSLDRPEETPSSLQRNVGALTSTYTDKFQNYLREPAGVTKHEYSAAFPYIEKETPAFLNRPEKSPLFSQHENEESRLLYAGEARNFPRETTVTAEQRYSVAPPRGDKSISAVNPEYRDESQVPGKNNHATLNIFYMLFAVTWAVLSLFLLIRILFHNLYILYVRHSAFAAKPSFLKTCKSIARELGIEAPAVLQSSSVKSPFLTGLFNPCILLPLG